MTLHTRMSNFAAIYADICELGTRPVEHARDRAAVARRLYDAIARGDSAIGIGTTVAPDLLADIWASFDVRVHPNGYMVMLPCVPGRTSKL